MKRRDFCRLCLITGAAAAVAASRLIAASPHYGANLTRLATLKRRFDPMTLFHLNATIKPA